jgi:hypothetical protein
MRRIRKKKEKLTYRLIPAHHLTSDSRTPFGEVFRPKEFQIGDGTMRSSAGLEVRDHSGEEPKKPRGRRRNDTDAELELRKPTQHARKISISLT